jgi:hypothetical protein
VSEEGAEEGWERAHHLASENGKLHLAKETGHRRLLETGFALLDTRHRGRLVDDFVCESEGVSEEKQKRGKRKGARSWQSRGSFVSTPLRSKTAQVREREADERIHSMKRFQKRRRRSSASKKVYLPVRRRESQLLPSLKVGGEERRTRRAIRIAVEAEREGDLDDEGEETHSGTTALASRDEHEESPENDGSADSFDGRVVEEAVGGRDEHWEREKRGKGEDGPSASQSNHRSFQPLVNQLILLLLRPEPVPRRTLDGHH